VKVPAELVKEWMAEFYGTPTFIGEVTTGIADRAAQWGANQELEACCKWVSGYCPRWPDGTKPEAKLRTARRPKPPSLAEQATTALHAIASGANDAREQCHDIATVTAALTRLAELEAQQ
jgi:hypothetical protein